LIPIWVRFITVPLVLSVLLVLRRLVSKMIFPTQRMREVLEQNGSPTTNLQMVLDSDAIANMRGKQSVLFKVNEAGTEQLLREGVLGRLQGFNIHSSAGVKRAPTSSLLVTW
jgi:hypothetical protein